MRSPCLHECAGVLPCRSRHATLTPSAVLVQSSCDTIERLQAVVDCRLASLRDACDALARMKQRAQHAEAVAWAVEQARVPARDSASNGASPPADASRQPVGHAFAQAPSQLDLCMRWLVQVDGRARRVSAQPAHVCVLRQLHRVARGAAALASAAVWFDEGGARLFVRDRLRTAELIQAPHVALRVLDVCGFERHVVDGSEVYSHPCFVRDRPELVVRIGVVRASSGPRAELSGQSPVEGLVDSARRRQRSRRVTAAEREGAAATHAVGSKRRVLPVDDSGSSSSSSVSSSSSSESGGESGVNGEAAARLPEGAPVLAAVTTIDDKVCEVCRSGDREDDILLCDSCDRGYHLDCLSPPLVSVPEGNWFCAPCIKRAYAAAAAHASRPRPGRRP